MSVENVTQTPIGRQRLWMAVVLGSLTALAPLSMDMYLPALPTMVSSMHSTQTLVQLTLTACLIGMALGQFLAGPISDSHGRRGPLLIGIALYVAASGLCAITSSVWALIVLRFIQGTCGAAGIVIARAIARDHYAGHALTRFFAMLMLVNGAAPILAPIVGGQLLRLTSWRGVFVVLSVLGILMWLGAALGLPESLPQERRTVNGLRQTARVMGRLIRDGWFMGLVFAQSLAFAVNSVGIIAMGQIAAHQSIRFGERRVLRTGLITAAIAGVALFCVAELHGPLLALLVPLFVAVASVGLIGTTTTSLALHSQGAVAGSASAMIGTFQMLLGALSAPLSGIAGATTAVPMGAVMAICEVGALVLFLLLVRE